MALAAVANLGVYAQAQLEGTDRTRDGNNVYGMYAHDFALADGRRIMLVVLTARHWHAVTDAAGLTETFEVLSRSLGADFDLEQDRFRHREVITALLRPWFVAQDLAGLKQAFEGRRIVWSEYTTIDEVASRLSENPLFRRIDQPGIGHHLAPSSPLVIDGARTTPRPAPDVGAHTEAILSTRLGAHTYRTLLADGVIGEGTTLDRRHS